MANFKKFFPAILWLFIITVISGFPGNQVPKVPIWQFDKLVHSLIYGILSFALIIAFNAGYKSSKTRILTITSIIFFGISYGGIMEIFQHYIFINRSGNWYDFFANAFGAILGVLFYPFIIKLLPIKRWFKI